MKIRFFVILSIVLYTLQADAQFSLKAQSDLFDEPQAGWAKLILLSNGSTAFFVLHDGSLSLRLYDASHRMKVSNEQTLSHDGNDKKLVFVTAFENGGSILVFCNAQIDDKINLYRYVIDEKTGRAGPETKIGEMLQIKRRAFSTKESIAPNYFVRKDPTSDHYAVASLNNTSEDHSKRMAIDYY